MTKTTESVLFLFSPPMQACYSLSSAPTINVCSIIFIIVISSSPINNKFYRPFSVALLYSNYGLLSDMYVFETFLSVHHLVAN